MRKLRNLVTCCKLNPTVKIRARNLGEPICITASCRTTQFLIVEEKSILLLKIAVLVIRERRSQQQLSCRLENQPIHQCSMLTSGEGS